MERGIQEPKRRRSERPYVVRQHVMCGEWRSSEDRRWSRLLSAMTCNATLHRNDYPSSIYLPTQHGPMGIQNLGGARTIGLKGKITYWQYQSHNAS
jgi:hypothetical protein